MSGDLVIRSVTLPLAGLNGLADEAAQEGHVFIERLIKDWEDGSNRFDRPGECLLAGYLTGDLYGDLVAIGGINIDPYEEAGTIGRVRRFYVRRDVRRLGVGRRLLQDLIVQAAQSLQTLRLRTFNPEASAFYVSCGFAEIEGEMVTHGMELGTQRKSTKM